MSTTAQPLSKKTIPTTHRAIVGAVRNANLISTPGAASHAFGYIVHPGVDFMHRILALLTAFAIVLGGYSFFDREFGAFALDTIVYSASAATAAASIFMGAVPECDSREERTAAVSAFKNAMLSLMDLTHERVPATLRATGAC
ncbi:MAG: hypothetical protein WAX57_02280 [Minisyncoccia bacterium]